MRLPKLDNLCEIKISRSIASNLYKNKSYNHMVVGLHTEDWLITTMDIDCGSWWSQVTLDYGQGNDHDLFRAL